MINRTPAYPNADGVSHTAYVLLGKMQKDVHLLKEKATQLTIPEKKRQIKEVKEVRRVILEGHRKLAKKYLNKIRNPKGDV